MRAEVELVILFDSCQFTQYCDHQFYSVCGIGHRPLVKVVIACIRNLVLVGRCIKNGKLIPKNQGAAVNMPIYGIINSLTKGFFSSYLWPYLILCGFLDFTK